MHDWTRRSIGFNAQISSNVEAQRQAKLHADVTPQDLVKFGLIPEFVGRVPIVGSAGWDWTERSLIRILMEPKNALIKQYQKLFGFDHVKLSFEKEAIEEIADLALERKTGARGLRSIMEKTMMDVMYQIPSDPSITQCVITKEAVEGTGKRWWYGVKNRDFWTALKKQNRMTVKDAARDRYGRRFLSYKEYDKNYSAGFYPKLRINREIAYDGKFQKTSGDRPAQHDDPAGYDDTF